MTIDEANQLAVKRILDSQPVLVGVARAVDVIPGMRRNLILHAGPPITWDHMWGPLRGAVIGGLLFQGLHSDERCDGALGDTRQVQSVPAKQLPDCRPGARRRDSANPVPLIVSKAV